MNLFNNGRNILFGLILLCLCNTALVVALELLRRWTVGLLVSPAYLGGGQPLDFLYLLHYGLLLAIFGIGVSQMLYVVPWAIWLRRRRHWATLKGVMIGAALTLCLNVSFIIVISGA
ncbi:MAG: hypothetical protein WBB01_03905 [Phormidesmis sp.]